MLYSDENLLRLPVPLFGVEKKYRQQVAFVIIGKQVEGGAFGLSDAAAGNVFFAVVFLAVIFSFINWRCPACNKYFGKGFNFKFCPKCGAVLQ